MAGESKVRYVILGKLRPTSKRTSFPELSRVCPPPLTATAPLDTPLRPPKMLSYSSLYMQSTSIRPPRNIQIHITFREEIGKRFAPQQSGGAESARMSGRRPLRSASCHDRLSEAGERSSSSSTTTTPTPIPRPGSHSKLLNALGGAVRAGSNGPAPSPRSPESKQRLTKLLLNVTVQRSLGPVHVIVSPESTVVDLIRAAVEAYVREGRRPLLTERDPRAYDLHYSQFSLESLDAAETLGNLGSRNFFLCSKPQNRADTCSNQAEKATEVPFPWLKFMEFKL